LKGEGCRERRALEGKERVGGGRVRAASDVMLLMLLARGREGVKLMKIYRKSASNV
jgi:hypothetical protein